MKIVRRLLIVLLEFYIIKNVYMEPQNHAVRTFKKFKFNIFYKFIYFQLQRIDRVYCNSSFLLTESIKCNVKVKSKSQSRMNITLVAKNPIRNIYVSLTNILFNSYCNKLYLLSYISLLDIDQ